MKRSEKLILAIKIFFFFYLAVVLVRLVFYSMREEVTPLGYGELIFLEDWTVTDPNGNVFSSGSSYRSNGDVKGTFTMTATLPDKIRQDTNFCVVVGGDTAIYVDGALRKDFVESRDIPYPGGCVKRFYMVTPLDPADAGAEITVVRSGTSRAGYVYQHTFLASAAGLYAFLMDEYGLSFMLAQILLIFSAVIVAISFVLRFQYRHRIEMVYGALTILVTSGWLITNSYLYPFIFGHYHIDGVINYLLCLMMPFNLIFYMDALQHGRYRKFMIGILALTVASCILWPSLHFAEIFSFPDALLYIDITLALQVIVVMGLLVYDAICGNLKEYRYTAIGFAGFLLAAIVEIVVLTLAPMMQDDIAMLIGLAILLTMSVVQQLHDLKQVREEGLRAVDLSEAKTRFLASMSHEIRTPINAVLGMNEMILRENRDPVIGDYAQSVKSAGQMLLMLVNDVLDFSKIEAGKMEIAHAPYRMSALLRSILPMLRERADEKNLELRTVISAAVPDGQISDEFRIRQILINLINNAIKYTDSGSVVLTVGGEYDTPDRYLLKLCIRDTGRGISEDGQAHLFEAFTRADLKKNSAIEGTGLGLAIVKSIVDSMEGEIRVTSTLGEGSEFEVRIPVGISDEELLKDDFAEQSAPAAATEAGCDFSAPDAKILAVDDNHSNLKLVRLFLKRTGILPDTCDSGQKAVERCRMIRYDMILLDHMMPEMDGIETLHHIRNDEGSRNRNVPVVVLTANVVAGSRQNYLDEGFSDYLTKPIDSALLERTVKKYLPKEKIKPPIAPKPEAPAAEPIRPEAAPRDASLTARMKRIEGLDYETALQHAGGMEDLLEEVVRTVAADCEENIEKMRSALAAGDLEEYGRIAHSVKGLMATVGHSPLSERAKKHEYAAKDGDSKTIGEDAEDFFAAYRELCEKLRG